MPDAGSVHVDILPDTKKFGPELRKDLEKYAHQGIKVGVTADMDQFRADMAQATSGRHGVEIGVRLNMGSATAQLQKLQAEINALSGRTVTVGVRTRHRFTENAVAGRAGARAAGAFQAAFESRLGRAAGAIPNVGVHADTDTARGRLDLLRREMTDLRSQRIGVDMDAENALMIVAELRAELALLERDPDIDVRVDSKAARAELAAFQADVERLDGKTATVHVKTKQGPQEKFTDMSPAIQAAMWTAGPAAIPAAGALTGGALGLLPGLGAGMAGTAGLIGVLIPAINQLSEVNKLAQKAATGNKEAIAAYEEELLKLSPALKNIDRDYQNFKRTYLDFVEASEDEVLGAFGRSLHVAGRALPSLVPMTKSAAQGLDGLNQSANKAFKDPDWYRFSAFLDRQAGPSLLSFGKSTGNVVAGIGGMMMAAEPLWDVMAPGLENLTKSFREWGLAADSDLGFMRFMDWTITNGPVFMGVFGDITGAVVDLGVAIAPLGTVYAEGIGLLADAISAVSEGAPWLLQLAVAAKTASVGFDLLQRANQGLIQPMRDLPGKLSGAKDQVASFGTNAGNAAGGVRGWRGALAGTAAVLGGPWGIALGGALLLGGAYIKQTAEKKEAEEEWAQALSDSKGAIDGNVQSLAAKRLQESGILESAKEAGIAGQVVVGALLEEGDARGALLGIYGDHQIASGKMQGMTLANADAEERLNAATEALYGPGKKWKDLTWEQREALSSVSTELKDQIEEMEGGKEILDLLEGALGRTAGKQWLLNGAMASGTNEVGRLRDGLMGLNNITLNAAQAELTYRATLDGVTAAIESNGVGLDKNTTAGVANRQTLLGLARDGNTWLDSMDNQELSAATLIHRSKEQRKEFIKVAKEMGATEEQANDLADEYLGMPDKIETAIRVDARGRWTVPDRDPEYLRKIFEAGGITGLATGGPVVGPGTGTSDSVPILASHGEHMLTAKEVQAAGGHRGVQDIRAAIRSGTFGQPLLRAKGGPIERNAAEQINDHREDVRVRIQQMYMALVGGVATDMAADFKKYAASGGGVVSAARSQLGVPYSWGGGGTSGPSRGFGRGANTVGFDCSSLMQYAWWQGARVPLPRVTYDQIGTGAAVRTGAQIPGDLVFPHLGHVAMYAGNGRLIHAPYTGSSVSYRPMYASPIAIRRPKRRAAGGPLDVGDWSWVGEEGPELVKVTSPSEVFSSHESARMVRDAAAVTAAQPSGAAAAPLVGEYHSHIHDGEATVREAMQEFDHTLRVLNRGGVFSAR